VEKLFVAKVAFVRSDTLVAAFHVVSPRGTGIDQGVRGRSKKP